MRILISIIRFEQGRTLGSEVYLKGFLESLSEIVEDEQIGIVGSTDTCCWIEKFAKNLIFLPQQLPASSLKKAIYERRNIEKIAENWKAEVIYFPFNIMPDVKKIPGVLLIHDLVNEFYCKNFPLFRPIYYRYVRSLVRNSIKRASSVITISNAIADELRAAKMLGDEQNLYVAPESVNPIVKKKDRPLNLPEDDLKIFLQPGAQLPHKNHITGVKAFYEIFREQPEKSGQIRLILTGAVNRDKKLKHFIEFNKLENNIIFLGRLAESELEWLMQNAAAICFPTLYEGFGLGVVEAQARGVPVLASDIPVLKETSGSAALFFDPADEKDLAEKIVSLLNFSQTERLQLINEGLKNIERWSWKAHSNKVLDVIKMTGRI